MVGGDYFCVGVAVNPEYCIPLPTDVAAMERKSRVSILCPHCGESFQRGASKKPFQISCDCGISLLCKDREVLMVYSAEGKLLRDYTKKTKGGERVSQDILSVGDILPFKAVLSCPICPRVLEVHAPTYGEFLEGQIRKTCQCGTAFGVLHRGDHLETEAISMPGK